MPFPINMQIMIWVITILYFSRLGFNISMCNTHKHVFPMETYIRNIIFFSEYFL